MAYLLDTNVISEARKGEAANAGVRAFWQDVEEAEIYVPVQVVGEIRRGVEVIRQRGDRDQAERLEVWLDQLIEEYPEKIIAFDGDCAQVWGRLMSPHYTHPVDKQIAAIALIHDMTLVTRNVSDFAGTGVRISNPFE